MKYFIGGAWCLHIFIIVQVIHNLINIKLQELFTKLHKKA